MNCLSFSETTSSAGLMRAYSIAGKAARRRFAFDPWCGGCALTGGGRFENPRDNPRGRVGGGRLGAQGVACVFWAWCEQTSDAVDDGVKRLSLAGLIASTRGRR